MHEEPELVGAPPIVYQPTNAKSVVVLCKNRYSPATVYEPLYSSLAEEVLPTLHTIASQDPTKSTHNNNKVYPQVYTVNVLLWMNASGSVPLSTPTQFLGGYIRTPTPWTACP